MNRSTGWVGVGRFNFLFLLRLFVFLGSLLFSSLIIIQFRSVTRFGFLLILISKRASIVGLIVIIIVVVIAFHFGVDFLGLVFGWDARGECEKLGEIQESTERVHEENVFEVSHSREGFLIGEFMLFQEILKRGVRHGFLEQVLVASRCGISRFNHGAFVGLEANGFPVLFLIFEEFFVVLEILLNANENLVLLNLSAESR